MDDKLSVRFRSDRGRSMTILGAISKDWRNMVYSYGEKTSVEFVVPFIHKVYRNKIPYRKMVIVLDNHRAHTAIATKQTAELLGIKLLFSPPTESHLNPIENMWGIFK